MKVVACPRARRNEKNKRKKQTDPCGKDKKEKQHKLREINIHFGLKHKR